MRFFVEVTPIGKTDTQQYCVDAESWQKALQSARSMRKEDGSISGFSIELADDGYRAVDPTARLRYMVKKAPADAQLTAASASSPPPAVASKSAPPPAVSKSAPPPTPPIAQPPAMAPQASSPPLAPALPLTASLAPPVPVVSAVAPPRVEEPKRPSGAAALGSSGAALLSSTTAQNAVPRASRPSAPRAAVVASPAVASPAAGSSAAEDAPSSKRPAGPIVVLYRREQAPTTASPISYREEVFAAPPGTPEDQAEAILRAQFQLIAEALATAPSGKYVNVAVFDRVFEGRPPVPPLATLTWKDWKGGGPIVTFPRRAKAQLATATQPSNLGAAAIAAQVVAQAPPASTRSAPQSNDARVVPPSSPPQRARVEPESDATVVVADDHAVEAAPVAEPQYAPPPVPQARLETAPIPLIAADPMPLVTPSSAPPPRPATFPPPNPTQREGAQSAGQIRRASWKQTPAALDGSRIRVRGDELIAVLFEEMHDLHFMADALEGAAFCLWIALDKLPSRAGFVHFYDIDKREYVIASVAGAAGVEQLTKRNSQGDPWLAEAMRRRAAFVVADAASHEGAGVERFASLGGARSVIVAPVMLGGRALGAIEIVNPLDGAPFGEDDGNAIAYMAEQFAEFVSSHGIVVDEAKIRRASQKS